MKGTCSVCGETESSWFAREMCSKHYKQAGRKAGFYKPKTYVSKKICTVAGCAKPQDSGGECKTHAMRRRRYGDPLALKRPQFRQFHCSFAGCENPHQGHGWCATHRVRLKRHGDVNHQKLVQDRAAPCNVEGCARVVGKYGDKGMCRYHSRKAQRAARPDHYRAVVDMRRRRVKRATPPWADLDAIYQFYLNCPPGHEVDHIIPLVHPEVSGLHVLDNLQYLPMEDNRRKLNRIDPALLEWTSAHTLSPQD